MTFFVGFPSFDASEELLENMIHGFSLSDIVPFKETTTMRPFSSAFTDVAFIEDIKPIRGKPTQKPIAAPASRPLKSNKLALKPLADQALKSDIKPIRRMTTQVAKMLSNNQTQISGSNVKHKIIHQKLNSDLLTIDGINDFIHTDKIFLLSSKVESENFHQFKYTKKQTEENDTIVEQKAE